MKKIITCFGLFALAFGVQAQVLEIRIVGETEDISGSIVEVAGGAIMEIGFEIENVSGSTINIKTQRLKIVELAGTGDYLCWALECYGEEVVSPMNPYDTPNVKELESDSSAFLISYHAAHGIVGCVRYRYYFIDDDSGIRIDSVDIQHCSTVSVDENEKFDISIFPNPVSEILTVNLDQNTNNVGFELYNVLGDIVMTKNLNKGPNQLDVQALPNGVYFYAILQEGNAVEVKKLVVRH